MNLYDYIGRSRISRRLAPVFSQPLLIIQLNQILAAQMKTARHKKIKQTYLNIFKMIIGTSVLFSLVNIIRQHRMTALLLAAVFSISSSLILVVITLIHLAVVRNRPSYLVFADKGICAAGDFHTWNSPGDKLDSIIIEDNILKISYTFVAKTHRLAYGMKATILWVDFNIEQTYDIRIKR
jgi:hypothetical protein